ncbi:hypothetical protein ALC62_15054, partial [Cyphomyrmex costatus]
SERRTIKHGGFGASREKTTHIFNARHVGTRFRTRTHTRSDRHTAKNTSAAINSETGGQRAKAAKEQNERRFSRFLGALNKRKEKDLNKSKIVSPRSRELPGLRGYELGNPRELFASLGGTPSRRTCPVRPSGSAFLPLLLFARIARVSRFCRMLSRDRYHRERKRKREKKRERRDVHISTMSPED